MTEEVLPFYREIRKEIERFSLLPGTRLSEADLTSRFGLSRTPVRDILKKLEEDGLVSVVPKSGTYVTPLNIKGFENEMYLRFCLEYSVMKSLFGKLRKQDVDALETMVRHQRDCLACADKIQGSESFYESDDAFHEFLYRLAEKEGVLHLLQDRSPTFSRYRRVTFFRDQAYLSSLCSLHQRILDAIVDEDEKELETASRLHQFSGLEGLGEVAKTHPDWFE